MTLCFISFLLSSRIQFLSFLLQNLSSPLYLFFLHETLQNYFTPVFPSFFLSISFKGFFEPFQLFVLQLSCFFECKSFCFLYANLTNDFRMAQNLLSFLLCSLHPPPTFSILTPSSPRCFPLPLFNYGQLLPPFSPTVLSTFTTK